MLDVIGDPELYDILTDIPDDVLWLMWTVSGDFSNQLVHTGKRARSLQEQPQNHRSHHSHNAQCYRQQEDQLSHRPRINLLKPTSVNSSKSFSIQQWNKAGWRMQQDRGMYEKEFI